MTTRTTRRSRGAALGAVALVAALVAGAATAPAHAAPEAATRPTAAAGDTKPGELVYLRAKSTPDTGRVTPRVVGSSRASTVKSSFVVTYHGFPANAKASFQRAVDLWSILIRSSVPIRIDATWKTLPTGVLGGAGATDYLRNFPGAPQSNTWYPVPLANARAGYDLSSKSDITAEFASNRSDWYLGTDGNVPAGKMDFTSVVLHEIGHGLGVTNGTSYSGGRGYWGAGTTTPDVFDKFAQSSSGASLVSYASGSSALGSVLTSNAVRWGGGQGVAANGGIKPYLYSPYPFEPGSSIAHLDESRYGTGTPNALMTPYLDDGESLHDPGDIVLGMLRDEGWTTVGAKGVPAAPTLKTALGGDKRVVLAWSPSIDTGRQPLTGYRIFRYDNGGASSAATYDVAAGATSTTISGLTNGQSYRFTVAAKNASGFSAQSAKSATIKPVVMTPFSRSDALVRQQFLDFHGREPSGGESLTWIAALHSGANTPIETVAGIARLNGSYDVSTRMTRLYSAYFERLPDFSGYTYWTGKLRAGSSLKKVSDTFAASSEFTNKYGPLSNTAFVNKVYENVLKRQPDAAGRTYWVNKLNKRTASRGQVMLNFSESNENINKMDSEVTSVLLRASMYRKMPSKVEHDADVAHLDGPATLEDLALEIMLSAPYDARVP